MSDTAKALGRVIVRSRSALGDHRAYSADDTDRQALEWEDCLDRSLPAERIEDAYKLAMRRKTNDFPLSVTEVNEAWRLIMGEESRPARPPCPGCDFEKEDGGRPCRFHNPAAALQVDSNRVKYDKEKR